MKYNIVGFLSEQNLINEINSLEVEHVMPEKSSTVSSFFELLGLIILLILILVAAYFTTKFLGGMKKNQLSNKNFTFIEAYPAGQGNTLQLIRMGKKYVVIAVCKDKVTYVTELSEEDVVLPEQVETKEKKPFSEILNKLNKK